MELTDTIAPVGVVVEKIGGWRTIGIVRCCFGKQGTDGGFLFCAQGVPGLGFGEVRLKPEVS